MPRTFQENLALYAKLTIRLGVNVQEGQELLLGADVNDAEFVRLLVAEAYRAGASNVQVLYGDEVNSLTRYQHGSDTAIGYAPQWLVDGMARAMEDGAARLVVSSNDPSLLKHVDPSKVAISSKAQGIAGRRLSELIGGFAINWCIVGAASPTWAKSIFPDETPERAMERLWEAIFLTSRVLEDDPLAVWSAHCAKLEERQDYLNSLRLDTLQFRGPGTDLRVCLVEDHIWVGGWGRAKNGVQCSPNIPTEEIFTMPHRGRVDGVVRSTKPLSVRGQVVEGIEMHFKDGAVTSATAEKGGETIQRLIDTDEGGRRLGEVALVPNSSKVSESGVLFLNTLYDENAASHIAMGRCYSENLEGYDELSEEQRLERGANDSIIHVDWMIGSSEVDVDGLKPDGSVVPLMKSGEWV